MADVTLAVGASKAVRVQNLGQNDDITQYRWVIRSNQTGGNVVDKNSTTTPGDFIIVPSPTNGEVTVAINPDEITEAGDYEAQLWGDTFTHTATDDGPMSGPITIRADDAPRSAA